MNLARTSGALVVVVAAASFAPAQDAKKDDREAKLRDIERRLYGKDQLDRRRAADEATALGVDEDFWFKFLDYKWDNEDDAEHAQELVARGLLYDGTARAVDRLDSLLAREPKVLRFDEATKQSVAIHGYPYWAFCARARISSALTLDKLEALVKGLPPLQKAETYAHLYADGQEAYERVRPREAIEKLNVHWFWLPTLERILKDLGDDGALGIAHIISAEVDPMKRGMLAHMMRSQFTKQHGRDRSDPSSTLPVSSKLREAAAIAIRGVLAARRSDGEKPLETGESSALLMACDLHLTEVESDLVGFADHTKVGSSHMKGDPGGPLVRVAINALAEIGTESSLDSAARLGANPAYHPKGLTERYLSQLAKEPADSERFLQLVHLLTEGLPDTSEFIDLRDLEAIHDRVLREVQAATGEQGKRLKDRAGRLELLINSTREAKEDGRRKDEEERARGGEK